MGDKRRWVEGGFWPNIFKLRDGALRGRFIGRSAGLSVKSFDNFLHRGFVSKLNMWSNLFVAFIQRRRRRWIRGRRRRGRGKRRRRKRTD